MIQLALIFLLLLLSLVYGESNQTSSVCCFESPITNLGRGQFWVNLTLVEVPIPEHPSSFSLSFASPYHFPSPIAIGVDDQPASCRLMNPSAAKEGSEWTCIGSEVRFRVDTNPENMDPLITQLTTNTSGICKGAAFCPLLLHPAGNDVIVPSPEDNNQISLGLLGTFDKGPVIASFVILGMLVIGLVAILYFRNRRKKDGGDEAALQGRNPTGTLGARGARLDSHGNPVKPFSLYRFMIGPFLPADKKQIKSVILDRSNLKEKKKKISDGKKKSKTETLIQITPPLPGSKLVPPTKTSSAQDPKEKKKDLSKVPSNFKSKKAPVEAPPPVRRAKIPPKTRSVQMTGGPNLLQRMQLQKPGERLQMSKPMEQTLPVARLPAKPASGRDIDGDSDAPLGLLYKRT